MAGYNPKNIPISKANPKARMIDILEITRGQLPY